MTNADPVTERSDADAQAVLAQADALVDQGQILDAVEMLHAANGAARHDDIEIRLAVLRHAAFDALDEQPGFSSWPVPVADLDQGSARIPQIAPSELTAEGVRWAILSHGCVHVPGLLSADRVAEFVEGIDHVLALRKANEGRPLDAHESWLVTLPLPIEQAATLARKWVAGDGGGLMCDSPRLLDRVLSTYEEVGLKKVLAEYLGERPVLSANKGTLRRARLNGGTDWHQDGAFLGTDLRTLNVWITLTDCGVDAPTMDIVPKRFDHIVETGTGGAIFDWAVGPAVVDQVSVDAPVVRPQFQAGDCMLFDEMLLHRTALSPEMTRTRHALEGWFFAPSAYPSGQVPIVW
jgi:hypothetical protein